ncbi:hypothetical protein LP419_19370 [Massilia sp. H-1]|nr:hypothetical protein LP419_19370 [Massilia sp. H-1]
MRGATRLVGGGLDAVLGRLAPALAAPPEWAGREALVAAVNGVVGDRLAASGNPLAIPDALARGQPLHPGASCCLRTACA